MQDGFSFTIIGENGDYSEVLFFITNGYASLTATAGVVPRSEHVAKQELYI